MRIFFTTKQRIERKIFRILHRKNAATTMPIDSHSIVLLGDSQTQFFEAARYFHNTNVRNRGISGDRTDQVLNRLENITTGKPEKIFIEIGVNDLLQGISADTTCKYISLIIEKIEKSSPATAIYLQNILPTANDLQLFAQNGVRVLPLIKKLNEKIERLAIQKSVNYVNLFDNFYLDNGLNPVYDCGDGLHLNHRAYLKWAALIARYF